MPKPIEEMDLVHFSRTRLDLTKRPMLQKQSKEGGMKPDGLWLTDMNCEHNWKWWCESEQFQVQNLKIPTGIIFKHDANILVISDVYELDVFHHNYLKTHDDSVDAEFSETLTRIGGHVDWYSVAQTWQGIIITPYIWERRLKYGMLWYYGWDCASGCIWDLDAIKGVILMHPNQYGKVKTKIEDEAEPSTPLIDQKKLFSQKGDSDNGDKKT